MDTPEEAGLNPYGLCDPADSQITLLNNLLVTGRPASSNKRPS